MLGLTTAPVVLREGVRGATLQSNEQPIMRSPVRRLLYLSFQGGPVTSKWHSKSPWLEHTRPTVH